MRFAYGCTRFVILTDRYAFKIARFRPFRPFVRIVQHLFGKKINPELLTYNAVMARGCVEYLVPGIFANRAEYRTFQECGESHILVPTLFSFFGLVNVQPVGKPATEVGVSQNPLYRALSDNLTFDVWEVDQYCVIDGETLLADYGQDGLRPLLLHHIR